MRKFKHASFMNITIGNIVQRNKSGRFTKKKDVFLPVNRRPPKKTARKTIGREFSKWAREDLERVFESIPDVNIDLLIENSKKRSSKKRRHKKRKAARNYLQKRKNTFES